MKNRLRELRESYNLTQKELGKDTGIEQSAISRIERHKREMTPRQEEILAEYFEIYIEDLYEKENIFDKIKNIFRR